MPFAAAAASSARARGSSLGGESLAKESAVRAKSLEGPLAAAGQFNAINSGHASV